MADATPESNLALIEELQELVSAEYAVPEGPEFSYPAVGQAVDDEMWRFITLALGSGILDEGGRPYWLRKLGSDSETNQANQMRLTVSTTLDNAQALLGGFYHRLLQDMRLDFPMPLSETTYYVVLELNPLKASSPEGPISVRVYPNELNTESGRQHLVMWKVIRKPNQLLTEATITNMRPKLTPTLQVDVREELPEPQSVLWGTLAIISTGYQGAEIVRAGGTDPNGGPSVWVSLTHPSFTDPGDTATFVWAGHGARRGKRVLTDGTVEFRGRIAKSDGKDFFAGGNNGQGYQVYHLPPEEAPVNTQRVITPASGYTNAALVVIATYPDGRVVAFPMSDTPWVSLDGVRFYSGR